MRTDRRRPLGREGFTLVEVVAAMVILAVGLLALEALGIGAARAVVAADRRSEYTAMATAQLERTLMSVRQTGSTAGSVATQQGATVTTTVVPAAIGTTGTTNYTVTVVVSPPTSLPVTVQPVTVVGRAIR